MKKQIPVWVLIPVFVLFITPFVLIYYFMNKDTANIDVSIVNSFDSSEKYEKSISDLENFYQEKKNPNTLLLIIDRYRNEEKPDYDKIIAYYEEYFNIADKKDINQAKQSFTEVLYKAGQKERYYRIVNELLNDKEYMLEGAFDDSSQIHSMHHLIMLMYPIVDNSISNIDDYNYAISKLTEYEIKNEKYLKEFDNSFLLYSLLSKLYYKIYDIQKSNFYKDKIIDKWDKNFKNEAVLNEFKNKMMNDLNQYVLD